MDAKIAVTTKCNAKCRTCPVWSLQDEVGQTMSLHDFSSIIDKLGESPLIGRILLNSTGDLYCLPDHREYLGYVEDHRKKAVTMTTNAVDLDYVPDIEELIISFNGGTREGFEHTVGADFDQVVANIRAMYPEFSKLQNLEMHCLIWEGNEGQEKDLVELWSDFPGKIRVSYKYDNQMKADRTLPAFQRDIRIPCDYLDVLTVMPNGQIVSCAHDFRSETNWGNLLTDSLSAITMNVARAQKRQEHESGLFLGLCEKCNYNTPAWGKVEYLR